MSGKKSIDEKIKDIQAAIEATSQAWCEFGGRTREDYEISHDLSVALDNLRNALKTAKKIKVGN